MPLYEYQCNECNAEFEILAVSSKMTDSIVCTNCNSDNIVRKISTFSANPKSSSQPQCGEPGACHSCPMK